MKVEELPRWVRSLAIAVAYLEQKGRSPQEIVDELLEEIKKEGEIR